MLPPAGNANIARHLGAMAALQPDRPALKVPRGRNGSSIDYLTLSFAELDREVAAWCHRLSSAGVRPGDRTLVMVRQGLPLIASVFALFKLGAVPVIIDPGMGLKSFLSCVQRSRPRALVGIPLARVASRVFRRAFASVEVRVGASSALAARLTSRATAAAVPFECCARGADDLAAILFTSGSTGTPKGVCYEHGMFEAQVQLVRETYGIQPGEVDLPLLPVFALFTPALGMTAVVPEIDPKRPATVDPAKIVQAIQQEGVTNSFGSPTLWRIIGDYCVANRIQLPSLRRVLCAGAAVPSALWQSAATWMPNGRLHSPYGATEALPVSTIAAGEIRQVAGRGACVGRPVRGIEVRIIAPVDGPIQSLERTRELPTGEIGEIIVHGPVVTKVYDAAPEATAAAKIADSRAAPKASGRDELAAPESAPRPGAVPGTCHLPLATCEPARGAGSPWHRMGDCGYRDAEGRIWFCGRKVERVETPAGTLYAEPCEQVFRTHPRVGRCALVGVGPRGGQRPAIVIEAVSDGDASRRAFARELRTLAKSHPETAAITQIYFHPKFPVDVRHNAKIHRLTLARWAATATPYDGEASA